MVDFEDMEYFEYMIHSRQYIVRFVLSFSLLGNVYAIDFQDTPPTTESLIAQFENPSIDSFIRMEIAKQLGETHDPKALAPLIAALKNKDSYVRSAATAGLGTLHNSAAIPELILVLQKDMKVDVREGAASALGQIGGSKAADALAETLDGNHSSAFFALSHMGPEAYPGLLKVLTGKDKNDEAKARAIEAVDSIAGHHGPIQNPQLVSALLDLLPSQHLNGFRAAEALAHSKDPSLIPQLVPELSTPSSYKGQMILEKIGDAGVPQMAALLHQPQPTNVRNTLIRLLSESKAKEAAPAIVHALSNSGVSQTDIDRDDAESRLVSSRDPQVLKFFADILDTGVPQTYRELLYSIQTIGNSGDASVLPVLLKQLWWRQDYKGMVVKALKVFRDIAGIAPFTDAIKHASWETAAQAAQALGLLGEKAAIPDLKEALRHPNEAVRERAGDALAALGDTAGVPALLKKLPTVQELRRIKNSGKPSPMDIPQSMYESLINQLGELHDSSAVLPLTDILENFKDNDYELTLRLWRNWWNDYYTPGALEQARANHDPMRTVKVAAARALGQIGDGRALPALRKALRDNNPYVIAEAAKALGLFKDIEAISGLVKAIQDGQRHEDIAVDEAISALESIGIADPKAIDALTKLQNDRRTNSIIAEHARKVIEKLSKLPVTPRVEHYQLERPTRKNTDKDKDAVTIVIRDDPRQYANPNFQ